MAKYVRKMEWKLLHIKHILYMWPFGALKIVPQSVGNKNGTKAVLQGWANEIHIERNGCIDDG